MSSWRADHIDKGIMGLYYDPTPKANEFRSSCRTSILWLSFQNLIGISSVLHLWNLFSEKSLYTFTCQKMAIWPKIRTLRIIFLLTVYQQFLIGFSVNKPMLLLGRTLMSIVLLLCYFSKWPNGKISNCGGYLENFLHQQDSSFERYFRTKEILIEKCYALSNWKWYPFIQETNLHFHFE